MTTILDTLSIEEYIKLLQTQVYNDKPVLTSKEFREKVRCYSLLEFKKLKGITNTLVWSYVDQEFLFDDLMNKFQNGFKNFCPEELRVVITSSDFSPVIVDPLYIIDKDEYKDSL